MAVAYLKVCLYYLKCQRQITNIIFKTILQHLHPFGPLVFHDEKELPSKIIIVCTKTQEKKSDYINENFGMHDSCETKSSKRTNNFQRPFSIVKGIK